MKINQLTTLFAILATMLFAVGCGESASTETAEEPTAAAEPATDEAADETEVEAAEAAQDEAEPKAEAAAGGSVCERAQRCCEAYVEAMNSMAPGTVTAETACAGIAAVRDTPGSIADSTCETTIEGFRTGLSAAQLDVPSSCEG